MKVSTHPILRIKSEETVFAENVNIKWVTSKDHARTVARTTTRDRYLELKRDKQQDAFCTAASDVEEATPSSARGISFIEDSP
ncbi:hypothetical protein P9112_009819 [Eukaryota sp. TZLM1-RC]